jgi:outer membrane protein OmpA-like peptidoglycan-associated protein
MRILITGFVVFVIWCFISAWLYNDHLLPALRQPVPVPQVQDQQAREADSLMKIKASMPKDITIYFEFDDAKLKTDVQTDNSVGEFKAWIEKYPGSKIVVSGHTDLVGTPEFNQELGMERAVVVGKYLEGLGIAPERIITESQGEMNPAAGYITPEQRAKNRRTEITIKLQ